MIPVDETQNIVLPYDRPQQGRLYSLGNMAILTVHDPPLDVQLLKSTYEFEKQIPSRRPPGIGFGEDAEAATVAFFGDRQEAARLFRQSWEKVWCSLRVTHPGWAKYPAMLPDGWTELEIERVWMNGSPRRLIARTGEPAKLPQE